MFVAIWTVSNYQAEAKPVSQAQSDQIIYAAGKNGERQLYLMNADGSNPHPLTTQGDKTEPNWSPDRRTIVYTANNDAGGSQIHVINANGSNDHAVTKDGGYAGSWSPDGQYIAFISDRTGGPQLFVMNADGSNVSQLTDDPQSEATEPSWSPDGRITFVYNKSGSGAVWLINIDGSSAQQLTHDTNGNVAGPSWSPDGIHLAYALTINGDSDILTSDQNGTNDAQIVSLSGKYADNVTWSPNGKQIAFMVWEKKKSKAIFVAAADRSGSLQQLSPASADDAGWPSWSSLPFKALSIAPSGGTASGGAPAMSASGLKIGDKARVNILDIDLKLRASPMIADNVVEKMPNGMIVTLIGGPVMGTSDSYTWWNIQTPAGNRGWTVEAADGINTLVPVQSNTTNVQTTSARGATALDSARVWSAPDVKHASVLQTLPPGTRVVIVGGPVIGPIRYDSDIRGNWYQVSFPNSNNPLGWMWDQRLSFDN
jgi:TolB protein